MNVRPTDLAPLILTALLGCRPPEEDLLREAITRQAEQNQSMAQLQREVAAGTRELVAGDADARRRSVDLQRQLQAERTRLSTSWDDLERQRQREAQRRRTESFLSALVQGGGGVAAALFALAALKSALSGDNGDEAELAALLLEEAPLLTSCRIQVAVSGSKSSSRPFSQRLRALRKEES